MVKEYEPMKINLQLFAEEGEETKTEVDEVKEETTPPADSGLPKTQEELDSIIEKRLERERKKNAEPKKPDDKGGDPETKATDDTELKQELLTARAQLEAFRSGIRGEVVEDAVYLALREAEKNGKTDTESIKEALKSVMQRHPEWKAESKQGGGFKVGAKSTGNQSTANEAIADIFGNKQ